MTQTVSASQYFNDNWKNYQKTINCDTLYHREMIAALSAFIQTHFGAGQFSLVDVGCGDSSTIIPALTDKALDSYIGIDAAPDILKLAAANAAKLNCKREFICGDMLSAIPQLSKPVEIIFTSYAVHHLSHAEKITFIEACKNKLTSNGFLLMVDGVLEQNQTREEWLQALANRMQTTQQLTDEEVASRMQHPRADDFPEAIATFAEIAKSWKKFEVLIDKGIFAFLIFSK